MKPQTDLKQMILNTSYQIDAKQANGLVKERNRFYNAILAIQKTVTIPAEEKQNLDFESKQKFEEVMLKCNEALKGVI